MTEREQITDELLRLAADHRHVYDGGYALVSTIREWAKTLDAESRLVLWDRLLESVAVQEPRLWGIAAAVLVEEHPEGIAERLDDLLVRQSTSEEWKNEIIFSLLSLGYRPAAVRCFKYIKKALRSGQDNALRLLAASCRVDSDECLTLSSEYFGRVLRRSGSEDEYASIVPTFVVHFSEVDERLFGELIKRTKNINIDAAKRLVALLDEYLTKPWNIREFGEDKVRAFRKQIHAAFDSSR